MPTSSYSTRDIINFLPLDPEVKGFILSRYPDKLPYDLKTQVEELAWDLYYEIYDTIYDQCLEEELDKLPGPPEPGYQDRVLAKTEEMMSKRVTTALTSTQIDTIREELGKLTHSIS